MKRVTFSATAIALSGLGALGILACETSVEPDHLSPLDRLSSTVASGVTSTLLARGSFAEVNIHTRSDGFGAKLKTKQTSDAVVTRNTMVPRGTTGWHSHPGPLLVTLTAGALTLYSADDPACTPTVYEYPAAFVDPGGGHVHIARNEGVVNVEWVSTAIAPVAGSTRIEADDPGTCSFDD